MKKVRLLLVTGLFAGMFTANAQLIDEKDVTITLDMQPVLQLDMTTPNQIEFVFDEVNEYQAGIIQYGASVLKVSSTVSWDLYAVGRSQGQNGPTFWDQKVDYGNDNANAINNLPLSLLELRQNRANSGDTGAGGTYSDYSAAFNASGTANGSNSIFVNTDGSATPPTTNDKYIAGHKGTSGNANEDFMSGGSYLTQTGVASDFYYVMDYRILPGLPATFPNAFNADASTAEDIVTANAAGNYAEPGVYTMYVQYILLEDQ